MNIHEYQAKEILAHYGVKMPRGKVAFSLPEAEEAGRLLGPGPYVMKAQVHAGGGEKEAESAKSRTWPKSARRDGRCSG